MNNHLKGLVLMSLPVLALGTWAWYIGRMASPASQSVSPVRPVPIPLDEPHIKAEIARQLTEKLKPVVWQGVPGRWFKFEKVEVTSCRIEPSRGLLHIHLVVSNSPTTLSKTQPQANDNLDYTVDFSLKKSPNGSRYHGAFPQPGMYTMHSRPFGVTILVQPQKVNATSQTHH